MVGPVRCRRRRRHCWRRKAQATQEQGSSQTGSLRNSSLRGGTSLRPHWLPAGLSPSSDGTAGDMIGAPRRCTRRSGVHPGRRGRMRAAPLPLLAPRTQVDQVRGAAADERLEGKSFKCETSLRPRWCPGDGGVTICSVPSPASAASLVRRQPGRCCQTRADPAPREGGSEDEGLEEAELPVVERLRGHAGAPHVQHQGCDGAADELVVSRGVCCVPGVLTARPACQGLRLHCPC